MRKGLFAAVTVALVALVVAGGYGGAKAAHKKKPPPTQYIAVLNTGQQVPLHDGDPVPDGAGSGVAHLTFNPSTKVLCLNLTVTGLSSQITIAHVHPGAPGVNNAAIVSLGAETDGVWRETCGPPGGDPTVLTDDQVKQLVHGQTYLNVHTINFPDGEVRGQIVPVV